MNSLFRPEIIQDLKLKQYGLEFLSRRPASFSPFPNHQYLILGNGLDEDQREIAKFSAKDADRYPKYEAMLNSIVKYVEPL